MVHIVEIQNSNNIRQIAGKEVDLSKRKITYALEFSIFLQFVFGFMISLMGLSGLPADLYFAAKMFGLGLGQTFSALPGLLAIKYKCNRIWIGYIFLQSLISLCQLAWFIVCVCVTPVHGWLAALYFCLFAFQMWCAVAAILHTKITSFPILIDELRKKSCSSNVKSAKKSKSMSSTSSKKLTSPTSSIKSKTEKKTVTKTSMETKEKPNVKIEKKASKSEQITEEKTKTLSSQQKPDLIGSTSKAEKNSFKEKLATIPEAKTPPTLTPRRPRYYFIEHATDLDTEISDESPAKEPVNINIDNKSSTTIVTVQKSIPSKPNIQKQQENSLLSSQATQNSSKSSAMNSSTTPITEKLVNPSPRPPTTTTTKATPVTTTTTPTPSSVAKSIQGALADPLNIINHQLLNKTL